MTAILQPLDLALWTICNQVLPWSNCFHEDPQFSMILLMYERLKSHVMSGSPCAGALVRSLYFSEGLVLFGAPFQGVSTGLICGLIQWPGNFRETWYPDLAESGSP